MASFVMSTRYCITWTDGGPLHVHLGGQHLLKQGLVLLPLLSHRLIHSALLCYHVGQLLIDIFQGRPEGVVLQKPHTTTLYCVFLVL